MTLRTGYLITTRRTILQDAERGGIPVGSLEAHEAILRVQAMLSRPTPPAARIPRVVPSRRR